MLRITLFLTMVLLSIIAGAQNFQGKATYKTHRNMDIKISTDQNAPNSAIQKKLHDQLKKMSQKTFTLNFNKTESTYTQNKELKPEPQAGGVSIVMIGDGGGNDVLYKDVNKKVYRNKTEISGKTFLIEDKLETVEWEMTAETKKIGKYTCYKATKSREEERVSYTMTDGDKEETKKKVTVITEVWYTPEIPVSNGPGMFWGLPGLILEVHEGKLTIVCSELVLNPSEKVTIKKPKKGKKVAQEKFNKIMREKTEEMMERFKNNRKSKNGGESISIEIQG